MIGELSVHGTMENKKRSLNSGSCDAASIKGKEMISPPAKKMKQARLPFKPVTSPSQLKLPSTPSPQVNKKKKKSDTPSPFFTSKAKHADKRTTPSKKADTPQPKKHTGMKGKKIGFASSDDAGKSAKSGQGASFVAETEVSSSSEDFKSTEKECDSTVGSGSGCDSSVPVKKAPKASLDCFVQTTQQPHVSTSDIVDLTDADDEMEDEDGDDVGQKVESQSEKSKEENVEKADEGHADANTSMSSVSSLVELSSDEESSDDNDDDEANDSDEESDTEKISEGVASPKGDRVDSSTKGEGKDANKIPVLPSTPANVLKPVKKTPTSAKTLQRIAETEKKRKEKLKQREERKRKLEEEREAKKKQKLDHRRVKEEEREAERRQKMEEKKKKNQEKLQKKEEEEKERIEKKKTKDEERVKKQQEIEAKHEEKRKKLEEKQKMEDEKKQKENALLMKKSKQSQAFKSFFKVQAAAPVKKVEVKGWYAPFEVKKDMVLAPSCRVDRETLDFSEVDGHLSLETQTCDTLYLDQLKSKSLKLGRSARTPGPSKPVDESMEVDSSPSPDETAKTKRAKLEGARMKMLQFHENYRPAYYGTWRKDTSLVSARNPFKKDEDLFDYEVESDDEWEEPGESLSNSEGEDEDGEGDDEEEDEDGFFVPHGYLSAGEGGEDEEDGDSLKKRQAAKAKAWENELRRRCEALKPIIISFIQVASTNKTRQEEKKKLEAYRAVPLTTVPIATSFTRQEKARANEEGGQCGEGGESSSYTAQQRLAGGIGNRLKPVTEDAMPDLLSLVHGNTAGIKSLIREFRDYWRRKEHQARGPAPSTETSPAATPTPRDTTSPVVGASPETGESPATESPTSGPSPSTVPGSTPSPQNLDHLDHVISKRQLDLKINSVAVREKRPDYKRICWYVHPHVLKKYKLTDLPIPTSWVNGRGLGDRNISPLPPRDISTRPAIATRSPPVNKPVVVKAPTVAVGGLKAPQSQQIPGRANQPIFIPSGSVASAFNKVSAAPGAVHLPMATSIPGVPSISFISPTGAVLQTGLSPYPVMPLHLQPAASQGSAATILQQVANASLFANLQQNVNTLGGRSGINVAHHQSKVPAYNGGSAPTVTCIPRMNTGAVPPMKTASSDPRSKVVSLAVSKRQAVAANPALPKPPTSSVPGAGVGPTLPSMQKSQKTIDAAIARLYESSSLAPKTQEKAKPVKPKTTLTKFFNVKKTEEPNTKTE